MAETNRAVLTTQPGLLDFGSNYVGATLAGSIQIVNATAFRGMMCLSDQDKTIRHEPSPPDWLELRGPRPTSQNSLAWDFSINTDTPGYRKASLKFDCDAGIGIVAISTTIKAGTASLGDLVICDEPFSCTCDRTSVASLVRVMGGLDLRVHHRRSLPQEATPWKGTLLLHGSGLIRTAKKAPQLVGQLAEGGTNVVVLADKFFRGTAEAANVVLAPLGMSLVDGKEEGAPSMEELHKRTIRVCDLGQIRSHPLTAGVRRMYWYRPWPIICRGPALAAPLVTNPLDPGQCFVAVAKPNTYVACVGKSLFGSLSSVGWPYDNDRLLANLLAGGDAEATESAGVRVPR